MKIKNLLLTIIINLVATSLLLAAPLSTNVLVSELEPNVGQDISVTLKINGDVNNPVYTLSSKVTFDSDKLTFKNAQILEEGALALTEVPYYITDNEEGVVVRTAGFPKGYTKQGNFIKYTFTTKKSGQAYIYFQGGQALNADNDDMGVEKKEILLSIGGTDIQPNESQAQVQTNSPSKIDTTVKKKSAAFYISGETATCQENDYDFSLVFKNGIDTSLQGKYLVSLYTQDGESLMNKEVEGEVVDNLMVLRLPKNTLPVGSMLLRVSNQNVKQISDKELGVMKCGPGQILKQVGGGNDFTYQVALGFFMLFLAFALVYIVWDKEHFKHSKYKVRRN